MSTIDTTDFAPSASLVPTKPADAAAELAQQVREYLARIGRKGGLAARSRSTLEEWQERSRRGGLAKRGYRRAKPKG